MQDNKVKLFWDCSEGYQFNMYRLDPELVQNNPFDPDNENYYTRINKLPLDYKFFIDYDIEFENDYYYKISTINEGMAEGPLSDYYHVRTGVDNHENWPVILNIDNYGVITSGSPIVKDIDGNETKRNIFYLRLRR